MRREEKRRERKEMRMGTPAGNGQRQRQFKLRTFVNERRQQPREMKSVQDTGGRWTLHGLDASARVRRIARTRTDGTHKRNPKRYARVEAKSREQTSRSEGRSSIQVRARAVGCERRSKTWSINYHRRGSKGYERDKQIVSLDSCLGASQRLRR